MTSGGPGAAFIPDTDRTNVEGKATAQWILGRASGTQEGRAAVIPAAGGDPTLVASLRASAGVGDPGTL